MQEAQPLCLNLRGEGISAGRIASRPAKAVDHAAARVHHPARRHGGAVARLARVKRRGRLGQKVMAMTADSQDNIMILGPKDDGTYVVELRQDAYRRKVR
jgi:hypothetical protein